MQAKKDEIEVVAGLAGTACLVVAVLSLLAQLAAPAQTQNMPGFALAVVVLGFMLKQWQVRCIKRLHRAVANS